MVESDRSGVGERNSSLHSSAETRIVFEGKSVPAVELKFETQSEGWSTSTLEDGATVKLKNVVSRVLRLLDRTKDDGSPFYVLEGTAVVTTIQPVAMQESGGERDR